MDRRALLKGVVALGATLILPPTLAENAEAARRYWALDRTMVGPSVQTFDLHQSYDWRTQTMTDYTGAIWRYVSITDYDDQGVLLPETQEIGWALMDDDNVVQEWHPIPAVSNPFRGQTPAPLIDDRR